MKLSEFKEAVREIVRTKFHEASISVGKAEYVKRNDSEDKLLDIAKKYADFPHTKLKAQKEIISAFKDISKLMGIPTSHPMDVIQYTSGKPKRTNIPKAIASKSPLFKMLKSGKLDKQEYMKLWKSLDRKYQGIVTNYLSLLFKIGTHVNVRGTGAGARKLAQSDMKNLGIDTIK